MSLTLHSIVILTFLPDSILSSKRFSVEEKALLIGRGKLGRTGILNKKIKWYQIKPALTDPLVLLLTFFMLLNEVRYPVLLFSTERSSHVKRS